MDPKPNKISLAGNTVNPYLYDTDNLISLTLSAYETNFSRKKNYILSYNIPINPTNLSHFLEQNEGCQMNRGSQI